MRETGRKNADINPLSIVAILFGVTLGVVVRWAIFLTIAVSVLFGINAVIGRSFGIIGVVASVVALGFADLIMKSFVVVKVWRKL